MTDVVLDALLEAVRALTEEAIDNIEFQDKESWDGEQRLDRLCATRDKLDVLIAQRKGWPDDVPAK